MHVPCRDQDNLPHGGGAVIGDAVSPICLSVPMLQKMPSLELLQQMTALIVHEVAHQAGYGEEDAAYLQKVTLDWYRNHAVYNEIVQEIGAAESAVLSAGDAVRFSDSAALCLNLGKADAHLEQIRASNGLTRFGFEVADEVLRQSDVVGRRGLSGLCGQHVKPGELARAIQEAYTGLKRMLQILPHCYDWHFSELTPGE